MLVRISKLLLNDKTLFGIVRLKMSTHAMIAVAQMNCTHDLEANWTISESLIRKSKTTVPSVKMVFLPEGFDYIARNPEESVANGMEENGEYIARFRNLAKELNVWLSLGGFHEKSNLGLKNFNTHLVLDDKGKTVGNYKKLHLFDIDIKGKVRVKESDFSIAGTKIVPPVRSPVGNVGLSTCYDLRFMQQSALLRENGAEILTFPSAFTLVTGMAHWEVTITNQCYVVAAAQTGSHNEKRTSYGHALVVDPWGVVVAQCADGNNVCFAEINLEYLKSVREQLPCYEHRRTDVYSLISKNPIYLDPDEPSVYEFGENIIPSAQVFLKTSLSYALVNRKPVVPGHVLIVSLRKVTKFTDLNELEVADLFRCVQKVQDQLERHFKLNSTTIAIQDGASAGQTVKHVHVHILPRVGDEFRENDDVYKKLMMHDKTHDGIRSPEEMATEAATFRTLFY